ncbi:hypothetical protein PRIPAC_80884 [Pristionchus pacificus]|uniref:Uncharacterized protein n=1 Tax=Pristionchus pacificus TaxID=54126 RepID=A0A2A6BY48_PRIPA|nr:hypothetical protein PRIPAC_80884 [Pristionchus pacificus]|eukprot:PDM70808.1 hypothetical protein PRIPAC_45012 [Pristionchus pacificus]
MVASIYSLSSIISLYRYMIRCLSERLKGDNNMTEVEHRMKDRRKQICVNNVIAKWRDVDAKAYEVTYECMAGGCQSNQDAIIALDNCFYEKFKDQIKQ